MNAGNQRRGYPEDVQLIPKQGDVGAKQMPNANLENGANQKEVSANFVGMTHKRRNQAAENKDGKQKYPLVTVMRPVHENQRTC